MMDSQEATLKKLSQGSRRDLSLIPEDCAKTTESFTLTRITQDDEAVMINADCSTHSLEGSSDIPSMGTSKEQWSRNVSVLYLFSRYKSSQNAVSSPDEETMVKKDSCSSASIFEP
ncbi:unnamed protein product [Ilex paraguariensis]|uniref:Uncharacterized protein n=1 Tax=Ilex paraguariensis TaxID=185542 RepID=A0ABC8SI52_9AQUA